MARLWRKWIAYPLTWVAVMALVLLIASCSGNRSGDQPPMSSFHGAYVASSDGVQVQLAVEETIVAMMANDRGIERRLITEYDGQDLDFSGFSAVDEDGQPWPVEVREEGSDVVLRIGDPNRRLSGYHSFVIRYTIGRAMIQERDRQELYFNVNGLEWPNRFGRVSAELEIAPELRPHLLGEHVCYHGPAGSRRTCDLAVDGARYSVDVGRLDAYENVTIAVGFEDATVSAPLSPLKPASHGWVGITILVGIGAVALALALVLRASARSLGRSEKGVVTQFTPPQGIDPLLAADFLGRPEKGPSAHLAFLAVTGAMTIQAPAGEQRPGPDRDDLSRIEARRLAQEVFLEWDRAEVSRDLRYVTRFLFGQPEQQQSLDSVHSRADYARIWQIRQDRVIDAGLRRTFKGHGWILTLGFFALLGYGGYQAWTGLAGLGWWFLLAGVVGTVLLLMAVHFIPTFGPLTRRGRQVRRELLGLERFIRLAEKDRIAWLQNVKDAPRDEERVRLYEKLLPWAIVFGAERSWASVVGQMHDQFPQLSPPMPVAWMPTLSHVEDQFHSAYEYERPTTWWNSRRDIGNGPTANAFRDVGQAVRNHDSNRSSGGGWGGGGGGSSFSGGSSGSSGGGFSGGGIGGGGGGRW